MGWGDGCLLNDEGYRALEGSSRPPLINLTVPWGTLGGFGPPIADPETAELVIACYDHGLPWAWTDSKKVLRDRSKKAGADVDGLYEELRRAGMVE